MVKKPDPTTIFFAGLIALIALINLVLPDSFYFFGLNTMSTLPAWFQLLWTAVILGLVFLMQKMEKPKDFPFIISGILITSIFIASFFIFRTKYPSLLGDAEPGARPCDPVIEWFRFPKAGGGRLPEVLSVFIGNLLPSSFRFNYGHTVLFDNFPVNNGWIIQTFIFAIATTLLVVLASNRLKQPASTKTALALFILCSWPMLNAYGHFRSFQSGIFFAWIWFLFLVSLGRQPGKWTNYPPVIITALMAAWCHPSYLLLIPYSLALAGLIILEKWKIRITLPLILLSAIIIGMAPLLYRVLPFYGNVGRTTLHTGLMSCIHCSLPVLVLLGFIVYDKHAELKKPDPLQATCIVMVTASTLLFFSSYYEYAIVMDIALAMYTALIYAGAVYLFFSTKADFKILALSALLGIYTCVPAIYVYSNGHLADRLMKLCPQDTASGTYQGMSPYVRLGLCMPIYTKADQQRRLSVFKTGFTNDIPDWQKFKGLNLMYYIAWCFEFGEIEEGSRVLLQVFNQPAALQDLWRNPTRFTDRYENRAYRRIRDVSRQIIEENLKTNPDNQYLQQLSQLLDQYEEKNP